MGCCVFTTACCVKLCESYIKLCDVALARRHARIMWKCDSLFVGVFLLQCAVELFASSGRNTHPRFCILLDDNIFSRVLTLYTQENKKYNCNFFLDLGKIKKWVREFSQFRVHFLYLSKKCYICCQNVNNKNTLVTLYFNFWWPYAATVFHDNSADLV